jgi:hypothetical protein
MIETHETYEQALSALAANGYRCRGGDPCAEIFDYEDAVSEPATLRREKFGYGWEIDYGDDVELV